MIRVLGSMTITRTVLLAIGIIAAGLELAALVWPRALPLISPTMRADGCRWVTWPALWGLLLGHLWSPTYLRFQVFVDVHPYVLIPLGVGVLLFDFFGPQVSVDTAFHLALAMVLVGATFWSQA